MSQKPKCSDLPKFRFSLLSHNINPEVCCQGSYGNAPMTSGTHSQPLRHKMAAVAPDFSRILGWRKGEPWRTKDRSRRVCVPSSGTRQLFQKSQPQTCAHLPDGTESWATPASGLCSCGHLPNKVLCLRRGQRVEGEGAGCCAGHWRTPPSSPDRACAGLRSTPVLSMKGFEGRPTPRQAGGSLSCELHKEAALRSSLPWRRPDQAKRERSAGG